MRSIHQNKRIGAYGRQIFTVHLKQILHFIQYGLTIQHLSTGKFQPYFCFSYNYIIYSLLRVSTHSPFVSITSYLYWINNIEETYAIKTCTKMLYSYQYFSTWMMINVFLQRLMRGNALCNQSLHYKKETKLNI